jgi:hypothetical protein
MIHLIWMLLLVWEWGFQNFSIFFYNISGGIIKYGEIIGMSKIKEKLNKLYKLTSIELFKPCDYFKNIINS